MIFDREGNTIVVHQENISLKQFLENLNSSYQEIKNNNVIINLFSFSDLSSGDILEFLNLSNRHRASKKSFVLVTDKVSFDQVPDEICVVPTLREAHDIIEMEEIERDLDF
ncbi:ribonuclease Z [Ulvibacterium marinum]|uniref:ribonuclease Z n=1 Tax=Ulvibacterium marinum TaxID=2419782 RepID=UPI002494F9A7|nr:ribonuclease Z [Ulvibacterium marinum]